jgi:serine carboxypeptidase-like clade 1
MPIRSRCAAVCYLACLGTVADGAVAADEVKSLPGWKGALPSRHYSGYLPARNGENHVHYYLQLSEGDPNKDPVSLSYHSRSALPCPS